MAETGFPGNPKKSFLPWSRVAKAVGFLKKKDFFVINILGKQMNALGASIITTNISVVQILN